MKLFKKNKYEYVFLSPIFNSISKQNYNTKFTLHELHQASDIGLIDSKVIALGGITPDNIATTMQLGFGGAAVLGYI